MTRMSSLGTTTDNGSLPSYKAQVAKARLLIAFTYSGRISLKHFILAQFCGAHSLRVLNVYLAHFFTILKLVLFFRGIASCFDFIANKSM